MAIEVHIQHDYTRDALSIYAYSNDTGAARRTYYTVDINGTLMVHTVDAGDEIAPLFVVPLWAQGADLMKALVAAATGVVEVTEATQRHLEDAMKVRDRLLTLIERKKS